MLMVSSGVGHRGRAHPTLSPDCASDVHTCIVIVLRSPHNLMSKGMQYATCPPAGTYFTAQPLEQRAASWYVPLFLLPGSEDAMMANDWALWKLWLAKHGGASNEQLAAWIAQMSEPGAAFDQVTTSVTRGGGGASLAKAKTFAPSLPSPPEQRQSCQAPGRGGGGGGLQK